MITFRQAPLVSAGTRPTSTHMAGLAHAFNDRILSGVADWAWRAAYYIVNLWRQVRNPADDGLTFPAQLEWFEAYSSINPDLTTTIWPIAEADTSEGANIACTAMAMIYGVGDLEPEPERFLDVPLWTSATPPTVRQIWDLGAAQRGARDPDTGLEYSPASYAAEAWQRIVAPAWSPHGKAYGGFLPTPEIGTTAATEPGDCGDTEETGQYVISYRYKFTALRSDVSVPVHHGTLTTPDGVPVVTYPGSCPCGTTFNAVGHVLGIWAGPQSYYVAVRTGATCATDYDIVRFPYVDWVQGPYTDAGYPEHTAGNHLNRVIHAFASDYRGSLEQRADDDFRIKDIAFPMQEFLTRQYALAPARGYTYELDGETYIAALYPEATWPNGTSIDPATPATFTAGGTTYATEPDHVIAGIIAQSTNLATEAVVTAYDGDTVLGYVRITPDAPDAILWLPNAQATTALKYLVTGATFSPAGQITVEAAELHDRKPQHWDAHLALRIGAANNGRQVDGRGIDITDANEIGDRLLAYGALFGNWPAGPEANEANTNPVYDVARRQSNQILRVLARRQFIAYEVADGKSILYVNRWAYGDQANHRDLLDGIAPPVDALGANPLTEGESYIVHSDAGTGTVIYHGAIYTHGQVFVAVAASLTHTPTGDAQLYVYDGIRTTARKRGWTNRWCAFAETKHYNPSESSIWKPDAFTDYWSFSDRCHFRSGSFPRNMLRLMSYNYEVDVDEEGRISRGDPRGQSALFAPEAPTGYRYVNGANQWVYMDPDDLVSFRSSCRVYEPPLQIESVTVHDRAAGTVKIVFSGRFHTHPHAPATWSATPPTWAAEDPKPAAVTALEAETDPNDGGYRTVDNALRSYHIHAANSHWNPEMTIGDYGQGSTITTDPGHPYAPIYPTIFLVSLIDEPYDDGNDIQNPHDTRMTVDQLQKAEILLRGGCHGWMDGLVTVERLCELNYGDIYDQGHLFDFTFESLNLQGHGGRWIGSVGLDARPETPEGFGPLPCTKIYADVFNRLAGCVNLLTRARVPVPTKLQYNRREYVGTVNRTYNTGNGCRYLTNATAPSASTFDNETDWTDFTIPPIGPPGFSPRQWCVAIDSPQEGLEARRYSYLTRIVPQDGWENCLPPGIAELVTTGYSGFVARLQNYRGWDKRLNLACAWEPFDEYDTETCEILQVGTHEADTPPVGDYMLSPDGVRGSEANTRIRLLLTDQTYLQVPTV